MCSQNSLAATFAAFSARVTRAFFNIQQTDSLKESGYKVAKVGVQRVMYSISDYWLMALSAVFIITMDRQLGYGPMALFLLMWAFDLVVANAFVAIWQRTGEDVTLGESYRRAADEIHTSHKLAGYLAFAGVVVKASFWDGPEHIVIFFHKEIKTNFRMFLALLGLTAIQAAIWTPIYVLGFDTITELWGYMMQFF